MKDEKPYTTIDPLLFYLYIIAQNLHHIEVQQLPGYTTESILSALHEKDHTLRRFSSLPLTAARIKS